MNREKFIEIMNKEDQEWTGDNAFQGLQIISKYTDKLICGASHDVIWSADIDDLIEKGITEKDVEELCRLNWMIEDGEYLACFV